MTELRDTIRLLLANQAVALPLIAAGYCGVIYEFLRPGKAWPGAFGAAIFVLGAWGLNTAPDSKRIPAVLLWTTTGAMIAVAAGLGFIAWRGWLNKTGA